MSSIETLSRQLQRYKRLKFHYDAQIAAKLTQVQAWQIQRMRTMHYDLFNKPENQKISEFLLQRLYNIADMRNLASQLNKALHEKIKLEKFLPGSVLQAAELGFGLAFITLNLDEEVAVYCLKNGHDEITEEVMRLATLELNQFKLRRKQLILLTQLSHELHNFGKSFLIQSAFRLAKRTAYRRGFDPLYNYLEEGFSAVRATPSAHIFFKSFTTQEKILIMRINNGNLYPFQSMLKTEQSPA